MISSVQKRFANPLVIRDYFNSDTDEMAPCRHYLQIVETSRIRWLKYFTKERVRTLFSIDISFLDMLGGPYSQLECWVYVRCVLDAAKEELGACADSIGAAKVEIHQEYAD
jgi:hypothetical protein